MAAAVRPAAPTWTVRITGRSTGREPGGSEYVTYVHELVHGAETYSIASRYSRFVWLDQEVRRAYKGSHLLSNVPRLPKKKWKAFVNHMSDDFLEDRQDQLENYLQRMSRLPGIQNVAAFMTFMTSTVTPPPSSATSAGRTSSGGRSLAASEDDGPRSSSPARRTTKDDDDDDDDDGGDDDDGDSGRPVKPVAPAATRPVAASPAAGKSQQPATPQQPMSPPPAATAPSGPLVASYLSRQADKGSKVWKRRWFALSAKGLFSYYDSEEDTTEKGSLTLDNRSSVKQLPTSATGKPHSFQLTTPARAYIFSADSATEQAKWCTALARFVKTGGDADADGGFDSFV